MTDRDAERFWAKVRKTRRCWVWTAAVSHNGYGVFRLAGKQRKAHRVSYEMHVGSIKPGMNVCHSCDNPSCVNPEHLWLGTHQDNMDDKASKDRLPDQRGERNPYCKLSAACVREIRRLSKVGKTQTEIAVAFGVTPSNVSCILRGKSWAHVR